MPTIRAERRRQRGRRGADRQSVSNPRVLLVEPREDTRELCTFLFEEAGYVVYHAANGVDALAVVNHRLPDLVVMDVAPSGRDGFAMLQALRADSATADIPAVIVADLLRYDAPERARESGATIVVAKPTAPVALLAAADELLKGTPVERFARRRIRRALRTLYTIGSRLNRDEDAMERIRTSIDRLQVAVLCIDGDGRCLAASTGAESLTGYTRQELLSMSIFDAAFGPNLPIAYDW